MSDLAVEFIEAHKKGDLLQIIEKKVRDNWRNPNNLHEELIELHNNRKIDVIESFKILKNGENSNTNFWTMWDVIRQILPKLEAPILTTMECVINLTKEAGQNMAADTLLQPFIDFCSVNPARPKDGLVIIEKFIGQFDDLLTSIVIAGARFDIEFYLDETIRLTRHSDINIRRKANFSLGSIEYAAISDALVNKALSCLELSIMEETDDGLLAHIIKSVFSLYKYVPLRIERVIDLIDKALLVGDDYAIHAGTQLFFSNFDQLPNLLLDCLLLRLLRVKPENKGSLKNIDFGLAQLLKREDREKGINFLETLLLAHTQNLTLDDFNSVMWAIYQNRNILNRLMTRWFIKGDKVLCNGIVSIVNLPPDQNIHLSIELSEFNSSNVFHIIFIARKSIGYLFSKPVTAASIIISLLRVTDNDETEAILIELLFNPLLINYPGMVTGYLKQNIGSEAEKVKTALETAMKLFDDYIENIKSMGNIPELHPPQLHRDIYYRRFSRLMSQAMKEAEKDAVFLSLASKAILLYGRKSIDYMYDADGKFNRMEIPLQSHSTEMEFPRLANIDPLGLDYRLRIFRAE